MYVSGPGLVLGDRDYYLKNDKRNKSVREAYQKLINRMMVLAGYKKGDAARIAKNVMKIEKLIADSTWTREESRNLPAMYNVRTIDQVKDMYPHPDSGDCNRYQYQYCQAGRQSYGVSFRP